MGLTCLDNLAGDILFALRDTVWNLNPIEGLRYEDEGIPRLQLWSFTRLRINEPHDLAFLPFGWRPFFGVDGFSKISFTMFGASIRR